MSKTFFESVEHASEKADNPAVAFLLGAAAGGKAGAMIGGNAAKFSDPTKKAKVVAGCALGGAVLGGAASAYFSVRRNLNKLRPVHGVPVQR